ncbi:hypothetical protein [Cognatiyoonia sp. IB215182]|uniref:hypothetical protein n=1 Tax=Cognatiyoonia sp. IB215182 TaxID=3097353 RepID=UPI002A161CC9|nr:hypothetical protein [Cognatiyoonia sp. IB215182]MDX8355764.1 hypothetical protein [Cognatiyoonia sp. IB215182]
MPEQIEPNSTYTSSARKLIISHLRLQDQHEQRSGEHQEIDRQAEQVNAWDVERSAIKALRISPSWERDCDTMRRVRYA